jgi:hypothetical protein
MGSTLLGVLRRTLRWSYESQKYKKLILKIWFFKRETQKKRENGRGWETVTGAGTGNRNGGGNGVRNGKCLGPEQRRVPPTSSLYNAFQTQAPQTIHIYTQRVCLNMTDHAYESTYDSVHDIRVMIFFAYMAIYFRHDWILVTVWGAELLLH